jgi:membrane protein implicated in regulation of membrane protease activity
MSRHWKGIIGLFAVTVLAFGAAVLTQSIAAAIIVFLLGLCLAFVLATAWMRPAGRPKEHHAAGDRILNDTSP